MPRAQVVYVEDLARFDTETIPDLYRPETMPDEDFVESVCTKGIHEPVIVTKLDDKYIVIDGKLRVAAAYECLRRGVVVKVPIVEEPIDLKSETGKTQALVLRFMLNWNVYGRDKVSMEEGLPVLKELLLELIKHDAEFANKLNQGIIDYNVTKRVSAWFGVTTETVRNWIKKLLKDKDIIDALSAKIAEMQQREPAPQPQPDVAFAKASAEVGSKLITIEVREPEETSREQRRIEPRQLTLRQVDETAVLCGTNVIPRDIYNELTSSSLLAPIIRDMCRIGTLTMDMAVDIAQTLKHDGEIRAMQIALAMHTTSDVLRIRGPMGFLDVVRAVSDETKVSGDSVMYYGIGALMILLLKKMADGNIHDFMASLHKAWALYTAKRVDEAYEVIKNAV